MNTYNLMVPELFFIKSITRPGSILFCLFWFHSKHNRLRLTFRKIIYFKEPLFPNLYSRRKNCFIYVPDFARERIIFWNAAGQNFRSIVPTRLGTTIACATFYVLDLFLLNLPIAYIRN